MNFISFHHLFSRVLIVTLLFSSFLTFAMELPQHGMSKSRVLQEFGSPTRKLPAVGQPPISRWVYADYIVYFQDGYVINAVLTHDPASH